MHCSSAAAATDIARQCPCVAVHFADILAQQRVKFRACYLFHAAHVFARLHVADAVQQRGLQLALASFARLEPLLQNLEVICELRCRTHDRRDMVWPAAVLAVAHYASVVGPQRCQQAATARLVRLRDLDSPSQ